MHRTMKQALILLAVIAVAVGAAVWWFSPGEARPGGGEGVAEESGDAGTREVSSRPLSQGGARIAPAAEGDEPGENEAEEAEESAEEEESGSEAPDEEEQKVNAFDDLTDRWMEPSAKGVTMNDIDNFARQFREIPKERQDECIHRALNLIPDENVMLLAGVLMDKSMDTEIVETVFNDILNRDEDVKKPILQQVFKDKKHPCWADTAWILDVTDELPKEK